MFLIEISESRDESASNDGGNESEGDGGALAKRWQSVSGALAKRKAARSCLCKTARLFTQTNGIISVY